MKKITNTTRYECDHCRKEYKIGPACEKHEKRCTRNPENKIACIGCLFLKEGKVMVFKETSYGTPYESSAKSFFCEKKQVGVYPPKVVHKDLVKYYPHQFEHQELMPKSCEHFKHELWGDVESAF